MTITGQLTLLNTPGVNVTALNGVAGANGVIIHADNGIINPIGALNYVGNGAVTMVQEPNDIRLISVDGTQAVVNNTAAMQGSLDYLDTLTNAQLYTDVSDPGRGRRLWGRGFGHFSAEEARDGNQAYDYNTAGTAMGGDIEIVGGLRLGLSAGYANTDANVIGNAAEADIDSEHAAFYARYDIGNFFMTGAVTSGLQQFDMKRKVAGLGGVSDTVVKAETDGYIYGGSLQTGVDLDVGSGWRLTPSAALLYQHQTVDGYQERGDRLSNVKMEDQKSEAIRLSGQVNLAKNIDFEGFDLTPHVSAGIANEITKGGKARGTFSDGTEFELELQDDNQVMGLAGAGISLGFDTGLALSLDYQGRLSGDTTDHGILAGIAFKW